MKSPTTPASRRASPAEDTSPAERRVARSVPAPLLVLTSVVSVQTGQAIGKGLFSAAGGPWGVVAIRLTFAALLLLAWWRPRLPRERTDILLILAFGTAIAGMNLGYLAMKYMPLGVAMTIQLMGPLVVSLCAARRLVHVLWGLLAVTGLVLFVSPGTDSAPPAIGLLFAVGSAVSMGSYLLLSKRAGARMSGGQPLALAVAWAALLTLPFGVLDSGSRMLEAHVLWVGLAVAVLSAAVPYSLELTALRHMPARVVGVLQSLEPVAAGIAGLLLLNEYLGGLQWLAIVCISAASAGTVATKDKSLLPPTAEPGTVKRSV
ncbi:EamA family transporter [Streptomyces sp. AC602_WCS936]|uniref:EamA family transporter n=1 Tax=Streptomyces sp. AC602_WCS936 TaxID=2823685 RepID=UPI0027E469AD|nr:EamA family transporter [Streptomyces sp. AC602_WCS936]